MGKRQKKSEAVWKPFLFGTLLTFCVYLSGILLMALLLVKGTLPESAAVPAIAVLCLLSTFSGGVVSVRGSSWGNLWSALLNTAIFGAILVVTGLSCWTEGIGGQGWTLLICALAGGVAAALVGGSKKRRRKSFAIKKEK